MLWCLLVCEKSWKRYLSLNWDRLLMSPGEVWCNGYGQMHFGYLTTCHYTVQESWGCLCIWKCCLFGGASDDLRLKSGHNGWSLLCILIELRCMCCAIEAECSAVWETLFILVRAGYALSKQVLHSGLCFSMKTQTPQLRCGPYDFSCCHQATAWTAQASIVSVYKFF